MSPPPPTFSIQWWESAFRFRDYISGCWQTELCLKEHTRDGEVTESFVMAGLVEDIGIILLGNKNGDIITLFKYLEGLYMDDLFYLVWLHKQTWDQWGKVVVRKNGLICHPSDGESVITPSCFRKLWVLCHWKYSEVRQPLSCWKCRWLLVLGSGCWTIAL